jgi:hypothetical protein
VNHYGGWAKGDKDGSPTTLDSHTIKFTMQKILLDTHPASMNRASGVNNMAAGTIVRGRLYTSLMQATESHDEWVKTRPMPPKNTSLNN